MIFSPKFEKTEPIAGSSGEFRIRSGCVSLETLQGLQGLWPQAVDFLQRVDVENWIPIMRAVADWAYPGNVGATTDKARRLQTFARVMLRDIVDIASDRPGILHWAKKTARVVKARIKMSPNNEFETLFPVDFRGRRRASTNKEVAAVRELAKKWSNAPASTIVPRILRFETEAKQADLHCTRWTWLACREIATHVDSPAQWTRILVDNDAPSDLVYPFLKKMADSNATGTSALVRKCLNNPNQLTAALEYVFEMPIPPPSLRAIAMAKLAADTTWLSLKIYNGVCAFHNQGWPAGVG